MKLDDLHNIYLANGKIIWTKELAVEVRSFMDDYHKKCIDNKNINNSEKIIYDSIMYLFDKYMDVPEVFITLENYYRFVTCISPSFLHEFGFDYSDFI